MNNSKQQKYFMRKVIIEYNLQLIFYFLSLLACSTLTRYLITSRFPLSYAFCGFTVLCISIKYKTKFMLSFSIAVSNGEFPFSSVILMFALHFSKRYFTTAFLLFSMALNNGVFPFLSSISIFACHDFTRYLTIFTFFSAARCNE